MNAKALLESIRRARELKSPDRKCCSLLSKSKRPELRFSRYLGRDHEVLKDGGEVAIDGDGLYTIGGIRE